ncbi:Nuclear control of ATPase protein 2 [Nowakowskiella sp. JEL0407]|nr:Nuclear control of ATPase protein 2 [Nowakowskiella sp. JEL0407]
MRMLVTLGLGLHAKVDFKSTSISIDNKRELNIVLLNDLDFMYTSLVTIKSIAIHDCLMNEEFFFQAVKTLETPVVNNPDQTEPTFETLHSKALTVLQELRALKSELSKLKSIHGAPHYILRNWIPIATTLILANRAASQFYFSFEVYQIWARELYLGAQAFLEEWIWKPMKGIWETVRHKETKLALMGAESLNSDLESLERMVVSFAKDHGVVDDAGIREIISKTQVGDLTIVLQEYEKQMRSPISNVIRGDLLRALLIQIQKAKVDGELAVSALDKLLRSNELNFAVLALFPSLAFVYFTYSWAIRTWNGRQYLNESIPLVRNSLRDISRLLNYAQTQDSDQTLGPYLHGLLLSELQLLQQHAKTALGNQYQLKSHFFMDVSDLESEKLSIRQKLGVIERMSRSYPRLVVEF